MSYEGKLINTKESLILLNNAVLEKISKKYPIPTGYPVGLLSTYQVAHHIKNRPCIRAFIFQSPPW
jgi:hypothetical protein